MGLGRRVVHGPFVACRENAQLAAALLDQEAVDQLIAEVGVNSLGELTDAILALPTMNDAPVSAAATAAN